MNNADEILRLMNAQNKQSSSKGNIFTNSLSTAGGILGGIGGSFLAPGIGTAAGGAAGAGFGKFLQNMLEGNDAGEGVLGEAALGTLGGIGKGLKAIKGATGALRAGEGGKDALSILRNGAPSGISPSSGGMLNRFGQTLEDKGNRLMSSQSKITGSQAREMDINPVEALGNVSRRTGLVKLNDMADISKGLTGGKDSVLDMLTREAIGSSKGVNIPDLHATAKTLLDDIGPLVKKSDRNDILGNAMRSGVAMRGGSKGTLSDLANPHSAFDQANAFRGTANDLKNNFTATPAQKQLARVYDSLASTIDDAIYKSPGVGENLPTLIKSGSSDILDKARELRAAGNISQAKALEKVGQELSHVKDVPGLRSFKKDFVDVGKVDKATAQAEGTRSINGENMTGQIKGMLFDAAKPRLGGSMANLGRRMQSGGVPPTAGDSLRSIASGGIPPTGVPPSSVMSGVVNGGIPDWMKIAGTQLGGRAVTDNLPGQANGVAPPDAASVLGGTIDPMTGTASGQFGTPNADSALGGSSGTGNLSESESMYSRENAAMDIQNDLQATGGQNMDKYLKLYEFLNPENKGGKANATTQKALSQSANAESTLSQLEGILGKAGGAGGPIGGNISSFFGGLGMNNDAKTYNDLASGSVTQIAKALGETGAMSDSDRIAYANLIPRITDTQEVASAKFAALRERMAAAQQNTLQYGAGNGIEDALAAAGY